MNWLRTSGGNWFRTITMTMKKDKLGFSAESIATLFRAVNRGPSHRQMNGGKLVMQLETDIVVKYRWPWLMSSALAWQLSKLICSNN